MLIMPEAAASQKSMVERCGRMMNQPLTTTTSSAREGYDRMPLITSAPDALPYIDAPVSEQALSQADAAIKAEMEHAQHLHPSIPAQREFNFSELVQAEHARIAAGLPKDGGLDLSRYELLDAPAKGDLAAWKTSLQTAYASAEYLGGREVNLSLLETYGKNAWLISNSQLEDNLKALEQELEAAKLEHEQIEQSRRNAQANAAGELRGLEESWKTGVGRMIETQAAAERLRQEILHRKRQSVA